MLTTREASAGQLQRHSGSGCRGCSLHSLWRGGHTFGPVLTTVQTPKSDGAAPATQLLIRREILAADLREARRKHRSTSDILVRLRAITNQTLLRRGCGDQQHFATGAKNERTCRV